MRHRPHAVAIVISILFTIAACQRNPFQLSLDPSGRSLSRTASASTTDDAVNSVFLVTADRVRKAFDDEEPRGEKKQSITVGEEKSIDVSAHDPLGGKETLKFSVLFLKPLEQARAGGYSFGLVAKGKTGADRKEIEDRAISNIVANSNEVTFRVSLQQPKNDDATIPRIAFRLLDKGGARIEPLIKPSTLVAPGKDFLTTVELAQEGEKLTFPLFAGASPKLTEKMQTMSLVVEIDGKEHSLEYALK